MSRHWLLLVGLIATVTVASVDAEAARTATITTHRWPTAIAMPAAAIVPALPAVATQDEGYTTEEYVVEPPMDDSNLQDAGNQDTQARRQFAT